MIPNRDLSLVRTLASLLAAWMVYGPGRSARAAEGPETQYRFNTWKTEQGLPQNSVKSIRQTRDGYLWFGTRFGISRFDGVTFQIYDRFNTPVLSEDDNCLAIAEELPKGTLWFATPSGIVGYHDGTFERFKLGNGRDDDRIFSMCLCRDGGTWIATAKGLYHFNDGTLAHYSTTDGLPINMVTAVFED